MASTKKSAATVDSHAKAYALLKERLAALPEDETLALNADLELAATAGLVLVDRGRVDGRAELFGLLEGKLMEPDILAKLERTCEAALHIVVESAREEAAQTGVKVDPVTVDQATETKKRMLKCTSYILEGNEDAEREIADIRRGTGYLDTARDLVRLAALYGVHGKVLSKDPKNYVATDHDDALRLAKSIRDQYRAAQSSSAPFVALQPKVFTEVARLYNEVRAAAVFIFRNRPSVLAEFEALRTAMATVKGRSGSSSKDSEGASPAPEKPAPGGND